MRLTWREKLLVGKLLEFATQEQGLMQEKERRQALALKRRIEREVAPRFGDEGPKGSRKVPEG